MHSAMEQAKYWMWTRRKFPLRPLLEPPAPATIPAAAIASPLAAAFYSESWEERVFAEDSAGLLGGCVWPPRSYSCSFCGREFRSAQALGGHMNVHRRDRARLKQSAMAGEEDQSELLHLSAPPPSQKPNPNPNPSFGFEVSLAPDALFGPPSPPAIGGENYPKTQSILRGVSGLKLWGEELKVGPKRWIMEEKEQQSSSYKRKKMNSFSLYSEENLEDLPEAEVINLSPETVEELDLELRLGALPEVK